MFLHNAPHRYKGNPDFVLRKHPVLKLQAVPQLYQWDTKTGTVSKTLVEEDCADVSKLDAFFS